MLEMERAGRVIYISMFCFRIQVKVLYRLLNAFLDLFFSFSLLCQTTFAV